jgi:cytochrome b involved in lipid metabolism
MNQNIKTITIIVTIVFLAGGLFFIFKNRAANGNAQRNQQKPTTKQEPKTVDHSATDKSMLTAEEVAKHTSDTDCWTIVENNVYDITSYIPNHPGGKKNIMRACGTDSTAMFTTSEGREHSQRAENLLQNYLIGPVVVASDVTN